MERVLDTWLEIEEAFRGQDQFVVDREAYSRMSLLPSNGWWRFAGADPNCIVFTRNPWETAHDPIVKDPAPRKGSGNTSSPTWGDKARELIYGERESDYGHPADNFARIAAKWSVTLGIPVSKEQVALCMIDLKTCRLVQDPSHADSWVDIIGYALCVARFDEER